MQELLKPPAIETQGLKVSIEGKLILWEIDLTLKAGQIAAIIGPNGAGKSTLLRALLGFVPRESGKVLFFGEPLKRAYKKIAFVPQRSEIDWDFPITVFEVVLMGRIGKRGLFGRPRRADKEAAIKTMHKLGILELANRQIRKLSGGQQQRLFLARALMQEADLLLLDEPFAGIDMTTEKSLIALFKELQSQGKTILLVHHDLSSARDYFDCIFLLNKRLIAQGAPEELLIRKNLERCYHVQGSLLDEVCKLSSDTQKGFAQ